MYRVHERQAAAAFVTEAAYFRDQRTSPTVACIVIVKPLYV